MPAEEPVSFDDDERAAYAQQAPDKSCTMFACIDPSAECVDDDDITVEMVENCGYIDGIGKASISLVRLFLRLSVCVSLAEEVRSR